MRKIVVLTEGESDPVNAKTGLSLLRYCPDEVVALLDSTRAGETAGQVFGKAAGPSAPRPVVDSVDEAVEKFGADTLSIGVATPGGGLPEEMRAAIVRAVEHGMRVESGMHSFLSDDPTLAALAKEHNATLVDVRKNQEHGVSQRKNINDTCLRVHTVGHDCSVGKMVASLEIARGLGARGVDAKFVATGQTGIMIEGDGCPIDCVVADFINGSAEKLVLANQGHEVMLIEGQGSLHNPRYSSVTLGLLHGCCPHAMIMVYEAARPHMLRLPHVAMPTLTQVIATYEHMANILTPPLTPAGVPGQAGATATPSKVIGIAMNTRRFATDAEVEDERKRAQDETGLPVCDVFRDGSDVLIDAVLSFNGQRPKP